MPGYNFTDEFVDAIRSGTKTQTIRAIGTRRHVKPGERMQLFMNPYRKSMCKIIEDPICTLAIPVTISRNHVESVRDYPPIVTITDTLDKEALARADGFPDFAAMAQYFEATHGLPFEGVLIKWA